jgi:hypothetical protein
MMALVAGLAIVLGHNVGPAVFCPACDLFGWLLVIRDVLLLVRRKP